MDNISATVPHSGETPQTVTLDPAALPANVTRRLLEIAFVARVRSTVNNARNTEIEKAVAADRKTFEDAEAAKKKADSKYKVQKYPAASEKAIRDDFTYTTDSVAVAQAEVERLLKGEIRAARGEGGKNKLLEGAVKANILTVLKSKGKSHKDALAMVGDDPMGFIEKTARKRAGDDDAAFVVELAKLNAQYVDPARALIGSASDTGEASEDGEEETAADDLI